MAYIGNTQLNQNYVPAVDFFSGNGSTTAFTLSRPVASVAAVQAVISNVPQDPGTAFTVSGSTITFTSAPPSGTNNIYVYYTSPNTQVVQPGQGTVSPSSLSTGGPYWNTSGNVGIGTSSPSRKLDVATTAADNFVKVNTTGAYNSGIEFANSGVVYGQIYFNNVSPYNLSILQQYSTGSLILGTNNTERMRIDSSGNVGIGTNSPVGKLDVNTNGSTSSPAYVYLTGGGSGGSVTGQTGISFRPIGAGTNGAASIQAFEDGLSTYAGYLTFSTRPTDTDVAPTERMRIDSSGNLLVGTTSVGGTGTYRGITLVGTSSAGASYDYAGAIYRYDATYENGFAFWNTRGGASPVGGPVMNFYVGSGMTKVGSISTSSTTTSYNTTSDYRLKENIQPMQNALGVVAQLNPVTYTWKADGSDGQGFIAHELQAVVPDCVTGEKDAVDEEGKPVYQGIDTSFLVATLTKAVQELNAKVEAQAAEIAALKGQA